VLDAEDFPVADCSEYLLEEDTVVWVDFCEPTEEQLHELAGELDWHELPSPRGPDARSGQQPDAA
jgi:magnesium transporter